MSALNWGQSGRRGAMPRAGLGASSWFDRFVLPKMLRKPMRTLGRMGRGDFTAPPFTATAMTAVLMASSLTYGAYLGGHLDGFVQDVTARTGFAVDQIKVVGNRETSEIDILDKLDLNGWTSLVGFSAEGARERIASLPWVEGVAVRKIYPHLLEVRIEERQAFAIWQRGSDLSIIERDGRVIAPYIGGDQSRLPLLVGVGAPEHAPDLMAKVAGFADLAKRVRGYIRVAERRWDLKLDNGITIKLPEDGIDQALADLARMDREKGILSRDIAAVDMRLPDRLTVQLTPEAVTAREAALKEQSKMAKRKAGQQI
ncbi:cell division protein FtsQ/DivIB [Rhizobiales bacterium 3FA27D7]|uniref:cell division protein FtsQ/DivIB n=1 Tax=Mesorhizobium sp. 2RAF21 TaxID=3232995 RepID=UPI0010F44B9A